MADREPVELLRYMQDVSSKLTSQIKDLRDGPYRKLYQQTRSFIDALERSNKGQGTMYGPSIRTIAEVRKCYDVSRLMDGDRKTHFTTVIGLFLDLVSHLQRMVEQAQEWISQPINELTVHPNQESTCKKVNDELTIWKRFTDEENDFTELHENTTLEGLRGLNSGEVPLWGGVVNLVPCLLKTAKIIAEEQSKWSGITGRLGMGIYSQERQDSSPAQNGRGSSRSTSSGRSRDSHARCQTKKSTKKTYADKVDEKNKGKISLHERPPWKPASTIPHNLFPKLHIHLSDPSKNF